MNIRHAATIAEVARDAWDSLTPADGPFLDYDFLAACEESGCLQPDQGWTPGYALADRDGQLCAAAPLILKTHSHGEFVWDWHWADAWDRAGLRYFPKLIVAAPFTPATGPRLLARGASDRAELLAALVEHTRRAGVSSLHLQFCTADEATLAAANGMSVRLNLQYHWTNPGFRDFADYLDALRSKRRKEIRRERAAVAAAGVSVVALHGAAIEERHADIMWTFYRDTHDRFGMVPVLNRAWFHATQRRMADRMLIVLATVGQRAVGAALHFVKGTSLFGRYWGGDPAISGLHFECCYYQAIEWAIAHRLRHVEAGAQGEHKFLRGYSARPTWSAHWFAHAGGHAAVAASLRHHNAHVEHAIAAYNAQSPVKSERAAAVE